jgi:hypothetical protein
MTIRFNCVLLCILGSGCVHLVKISYPPEAVIHPAFDKPYTIWRRERVQVDWTPMRNRDVLERVQRRGLVEHSESRQIKAGVDKEIRGGIAHHCHQADVHNLRRKVAHDMHADQLQIVLTKEQLKKAIRVADDPATAVLLCLPATTSTASPVSAAPEESSSRTPPDSSGMHFCTFSLQ